MVSVDDLISDIRFRTSLLESLEWDEDRLQAFLLFFAEAMKKGIHPQIILEDTKESYGIPTYTIVVELFKEEALNLDIYLNNKREDN